MNKCTIDGCAADARKRGRCNRHYLAWYKHGEPGNPRPTRPECIVDGCNKESRSAAHAMCDAHYHRIRRNGDLVVRDTRRPDARYRAAHGRIERDRGKARAYSCVDCGSIAHHWSYQHTDTDERVSDTGQPYSLDPSHYAPRCAPCHAIFDGTGANQYTR